MGQRGEFRCKVVDKQEMVFHSCPKTRRSLSQWSRQVYSENNEMQTYEGITHLFEPRLCDPCFLAPIERFLNLRGSSMSVASVLNVTCLLQQSSVSAYILFLVFNSVVYVICFVRYSNHSGSHRESSGAKHSFKLTMFMTQ